MMMQNKSPHPMPQEEGQSEQQFLPHVHRNNMHSLLLRNSSRHKRQNASESAAGGIVDGCCFDYFYTGWFLFVF